MKKLIFPLLILVVVGGLVFFFQNDNSRSVSENTKIQIQENFGKIPLYFEKNEGQAGDEIDFISRGQGYGFYIKPTESFFQMSDDLVKMKLKGANEKANGSGLDQQKAKINYLTGNDSRKWRTGISTYAKVKYDQVYPGIDVVYYGNQQKLEYDFVVAPNTDYSLITLSFEGAEKIAINDKGDLVLTIKEGKELIQKRPKIYQDIDKEQKIIDGSYVLKDKDEVGFKVAAYDATKPLVIDPVLEFSTYLGGGGYDNVRDIVVDSVGNVYITGYTSSSNFPTANAHQSIYATEYDVFVTKLNTDGSALIYSTYLGGSGDDYGEGIAVDSFGSAYITGSTSSIDFPIVSKTAFQTTNGNDSDFYYSSDVFVTKLNANGSSLIYSTYLGGGSDDIGYDIAVDPLGQVYVTGRACGDDFPVTSGAYQTTRAGTCNAFVTKLNRYGSGLVYSTYLGGESIDYGEGIAIDSSRNAYVTGATGSTDFPVTSSVYQNTYGGGDKDIFVTKLNTQGSALVYSTYLGGNNTETGHGIAVDSSENAYVTGETESTDFPVTSNAIQTTYGGGQRDAFVLKLNGTGSSLIYSTYLGGSATLDDRGEDIVVDSLGHAHVTGDTDSTDFPVTSNAYDLIGDGRDVFVTKLNADGSALIYSTYLGGNYSDLGKGIAIDSVGDIYVIGDTYSTDFPVTPNVFQEAIAPYTTLVINSDSFIAKFSDIPVVDAEICNGVDDDDDGSVDEGLIRIFYRDADGDGWGIPGTVIKACSPPKGYVFSPPKDCNDNAGPINNGSAIYPGATEVCNHKDDDCDNKVDEGFWWAGKKCYKIELNPNFL